MPEPRRRTTMELNSEGLIVIKREQTAGISGNAAQRKKLLKAGHQLNWRVVDRTISKHGGVPEKAKNWPPFDHLNMDSEGVGAANEVVANHFIALAEDTVTMIRRRVAQFTVTAPKPIRVVLEEVSEIA